MVHVSANLRKFLTIKSERDAMPTTKKTEPKTKTKKAMALPGEARTALIEGVMDALEKLTGVTQALKSATIDDNASVPDELPRMIKEASDGLLKVAGSYFSDEDADGDDTAKAAAEAAVIAATKKARRFTPKRRATIETATAALTELLAETADGDDDDGDGGDDDTTQKTLSEVLDAVKLLGVRLDETSKAANAKAVKTAKTADDAAAAIVELQGELNDAGDSHSTEPAAATSATEKGEKKVVWEDDFAAQVMNKAKG